MSAVSKGQISVLVTACFVLAGGLAVRAEDEMPQEKPATALPTDGNPLKDLFTPQPQYLTPQAIANPQPAAPAQGESNPLKGLFTPQPQYATPQAMSNPHPEPKDGEVNHFKGLYTPQPQYLTPQAIVNPEAQPRFYVPERLPKESEGSPRSKSDDLFPDAGIGGSDSPAGAKPAAVSESKAAKKAVGEKTKSGDKKGVSKAPSKRIQMQQAPVVDVHSAAIDHPLRKAMVCMRASNYSKCLELLDQAIKSDPKNSAQAYYLSAVAHVMLRHYADAAASYRKTIELTSDQDLKTRAKEGLRKLGISHIAH